MTNLEIEQLQIMSQVQPEPSDKSLAVANESDGVQVLVAAQGDDYKEFLKSLGVQDIDIEKNYRRMVSDELEGLGGPKPKKKEIWALTLDALEIATRTINNNRNIKSKDTLGKYLDVLDGEVNFELVLEAGHTYTLPSI